MHYISPHTVMVLSYVKLLRQQFPVIHSNTKYFVDGIKSIINGFSVRDIILNNLSVLTQSVAQF